jgi:Phosphoenolpyruvate carboxykinase
VLENVVMNDIGEVRSPHLVSGSLCCTLPYACCQALSLSGTEQFFLLAVACCRQSEALLWHYLLTVDTSVVQVDYDDVSITENTRASYPIEFIDNAALPCVGPHPKNLVLLCCDAFSVLPPVARLSQAQAMYHFISGYTAKVRLALHLAA